MESVAYRNLVLGERAREASRTRKARGDGPGDNTDRKLSSVLGHYLHEDTGRVGTYGDRILDVNFPLCVSSEAAAVCDVLQHGPIWVLCLAVYDREGELEGCFRVGSEGNVVRFTAADFDTCQGVPSFCTGRGVRERPDDSQSAVKG